jgi:hypothetical protein
MLWWNPQHLSPYFKDEANDELMKYNEIHILISIRVCVTSNSLECSYHQGS